MRLKPEQLGTHLKRGELAPVYFISGDEPLQRLESLDLIRSKARQSGYDERNVFNIDKSFDWESFNQASANLSLFASRRIIELRMAAPKPGKEGAATIIGCLEEANPDTILLISAEKMDKSVQNTKWVKAVEKVGVLIQTWPVSPAQLPDWIQGRFKLLDKQIDHDAAQFIAQRVEGNLLAARQEIEKLNLLIDKPSIALGDILNAVADSSRYDVFAMIESAYFGSVERTLTMLHGLRKEGTEPIVLFGALMWEFRRTCFLAFEKARGSNMDQLYRQHRIWDAKQRSIEAVLRRHDCKQLQKLLAYCAKLDRTLKSADKQMAWEKLDMLLLAIAGVISQLI